MIYSRKSSVLSNDINGIFSKTFGNVGGIFNLTFNQIIKSLFANSEQGFAYDPNDLTTMFQDAAGTVPVTAVGQPVGLILDKSKGFGFGGELVTNGDFSNGLTGWAAGTNASMTLSSGELILTTPGSQVVTVNNAVYHTVIGHYAGRRYNIEFDATYISGGDLSVGVGNQPAIIVSSAQNAGQKKRYTCSLSDIAVSPTRVITFASKDVLSTWRIDNVSCKQVLGNHAYQTTSASRPILRRNATTDAYYLEFDGTDDYLIVPKDNLKFLHDGTGASGFVGFKPSGANMYHTLLNTGNLGSASIVGYALAQDDRVSGNVINVVSNGSGTQHVNNVVTTGISSNPRIVSFKNKLGTHVVRNNTVQVVNSPTETGSPSTASSANDLWIGRAPAGLPLSGNLYGVVCINRLTSDSETIALEKALAKQTGVML